MLPSKQRLVPLIDIGANLGHPQLSRDAHEFDNMLRRAEAVGVRDIVVTGTSMRSSRDAVKLCREYNGAKDGERAKALRLTCTVGVHPHDAKDFDLVRTPPLMSELLADANVVAVGECGLDFNRNFSPQDVQIAVFEVRYLLNVDA